LIFRSKLILLGAVVSCLGASMWSLMAIHLLGIKIGVMTANLATIVFVLTLSHIIFLTYNWKFVCGQGQPSVEEAVDLTFSPSFWSMMTTLLGFLSLLLVPAQPLKELGASGITGAMIAIMVAYSIYPAFLRLVDPRRAQHNSLDRYQARVGKILEKRKHLTIGIISILFLIALPGLWRANTDPSLLSYFAQNSEVGRNLTYIDKHGGSSPLIVVVKSTSGERLDTRRAYTQLWKLERDLEKNKQIGTILSLPVLMAQAKKPMLASFLSWRWILDILQMPQFESAASSFITPDHLNGLFLLRMNESNRKIPRLKVIEGIKQTIIADGFEPEMTGGTYNLQGHLAQLIAQSIINGLSRLIVIFTLIAWIVSRSWRIAFAISVSICVIPVIVLGMIGWLRVPLDIISAPACNIAIGLGIDSMIHMVRAYRRQKRKNKDPDAWGAIRDRFWQPVMTFTLVMVLGFGIFGFSEFPSTQRFGMAVVFGAIIAAMTALFVMPSAAHWEIKRPSR
jgi:predicted RND superfamily exporter protein